MRPNKSGFWVMLLLMTLAVGHATMAFAQISYAPIKAADITNLRTAIDTKRASCGLPATSWTDNPLVAGIPIKAVHLTELRTSTTALAVASGVRPPSFTDPVIIRQTTPVKAIHFQEIAADVGSIICGGSPPCLIDGTSTGGSHLFAANSFNSSVWSGTGVPESTAQCCSGVGWARSPSCPGLNCAAVSIGTTCGSPPPPPLMCLGVPRPRVRPPPGPCAGRWMRCGGSLWTCDPVAGWTWDSGLVCKTSPLVVCP